MKSLIAIFFFVIYTTTAFGVVVKFHFCDQALTHISLSGSSDKCDRNGHSLMSMDCCKDKTICLKVNGRIITQQPFVVAPVFHQADLIPFSDPNQIILGAGNYIPIIHFAGPQRIPPERIYLLNKVFRI
jgi:hypothetical protein